MGEKLLRAALGSILIFMATLALGQEKIRNDSLILGRSVATDKKIIFDKAAGASNPTLKVTSTGVLEFASDGSNFMGVVAPVGAVQMYAGAAAPNGWKLCDGAQISKTTYAALCAVIGTTYGAETDCSGGAGTTCCRLPDMRGVYAKGAGATDRALGKDANNAAYSGTLGTYSTDRMQGHKHTGTTGDVSADHSHVLAASMFGYGDMNNLANNTYANQGKVIQTFDFTSGGSPSGKDTNGASNGHTHDLTTAAALAADGTNGTPRTNVTTEPQNLALTYIIKY